jgi:hypothetical protein
MHQQVMTVNRAQELAKMPDAGLDCLRESDTHTDPSPSRDDDG